MEFQVVRPFKLFHQNTVCVCTSLIFRIRAKNPAYLILLDFKIESRGNSVESVDIQPLFLDDTAHAMIIT